MFYEFQVPDNLEDRLNHSASPLHKAASFQGKKQLRVTDTAIGYIIGPFWLSGREGWIGWRCDLFMRYILNLVGPAIKQNEFYFFCSKMFNFV